MRDQLKPEPVLEMLASQRREHVLVQQLRQHDRRERPSGLVGVAQRAHRKVLVVELKPAADVLSGLSRTCARCRRANTTLRRVAPTIRFRVLLVRDPDAQPRQERGHVLARQRARLLTPVLTTRADSRTGAASSRRRGARSLASGYESRSIVYPFDRLAQPPLVKPGEVHRALLAQPEHTEVPHVLDALLLRCRGQPPARR